MGWVVWCSFARRSRRLAGAVGISASFLACTNQKVAEGAPPTAVVPSAPLAAIPARDPSPAPSVPPAGTIRERAERLLFPERPTPAFVPRVAAVCASDYVELRGTCVHGWHFAHTEHDTLLAQLDAYRTGAA